MLLMMSVPTSPCLLECLASGIQALVSILELGSRRWLLPPRLLLLLLLPPQLGETLVKASGGGTGDPRFYGGGEKTSLNWCRGGRRMILWMNMYRFEEATLNTTDLLVNNGMNEHSVLHCKHSGDSSRALC